MRNHDPPSRCGRCGKVMYTSWRHAAHDAREMRRRYTRRRREYPYFSRQCQTFHVGRLHRKRPLTMTHTRTRPQPPTPIRVTFQAGGSLELVPDPDGTTGIYLDDRDGISAYGAVVTSDDLRAIADACVEASS